MSTMEDTFFGPNKFVGPQAITQRCGRGGKGIKVVKTLDLSDQSQQMITVECTHGRRQVRWNRRYQLCRKCNAHSGAYSTCRKGRVITWGDKISKTKKGVKATEAHKKALVAARKDKLCRKLNLSVEEFPGFPTVGVHARIRAFMGNAVHRNVITHTTQELDTYFLKTLGYAVDDLRLHIQAQFKLGMTWDNYGEWEIDHVTPDSWFVYSSVDDEGFKKSWSLTNLQPMWAIHNRKKNAIYSGQYKDKKIYVVCGQHGVGKSTLSAQLINKYTTVSYDEQTIKSLDKFIRNNWHNDKPILLELPIKISTMINRYVKAGYQVIPVFIVESVETVKGRLLQRGGTIQNVEKRHARILSLVQRYSTFTGTYQEVLEYLSGIIVQDEQKTT